MELGVQRFPECISPNVNGIERPEFELAYYDTHTHTHIYIYIYICIYIYIYIYIYI